MADASEVKEFYDRFSDDVLLEDFRRLNLRQDAVRRLCRKFVPRGARVLEIGCGVGINVKYLRKLASSVVGVDISDRNIEIARAFAGSPGTEFKVLDVMEGGEDLARLGPFDVVVLPDLIEHIPKERYPALFATIERLLARPGWILIAYPSPEYQEHLRADRPEALQVVDYSVELDDILRSTGLKLVYFSYKHVWSRNQYVHVVLASDRTFRPVDMQWTRIERFRYRVRKRFWRLRNRRFLGRTRGRPGPSCGAAR